jgi:hypothetical protein
MANKSLFLLVACLLLVAPGWSGHTLTAQEQKVLKEWLAQHQEYRIATDKDCDCAEDINQVKTGYGGKVKPIPDYHPYVATGDFNGDGVRDFAVVVIERSKQEKNFALVVFNGPFKSETASAAFMQSGLDLKYAGLAYGPPRPKPYRLVLGPFESDSGVLLVPYGHSYRLEHPEEE